MAHLSLDAAQVARCRKLAEEIARPVGEMISRHTTVGLERTVLRLLGVSGAVRQRDGSWFPEVNATVEGLRREGALAHGALHWFANGMIQKKMSASELGAAVAAGNVALTKLPRAPEAEVRRFAVELC